MDIASSIQKVTEDIMIKLAKSTYEEYGLKNLCLAGGVALNCVANGKILRNKIFENIWVQPASGDAGGALGAALALWHIEQGNPRTVNKYDDMRGSYLGPEYSQEEIEKELNRLGANFKTLNENHIIDKTAEDISKGDAIGWFQGRMEFGPRALGNRSILGDPRSDKMQKNLNLKVKFRESFRPFAPSILIEDLKEWFDLEEESPYMLLVSNVKKDKIGDLWPLMAAHENQDDDIRKFEEIGTHPAANYLAIGEAVTFHEGIGSERKEARLKYLNDLWIDELIDEPKVTLHTSRNPSFACGIATVEVKGKDPSELSSSLWKKHNIIVTPIKHHQFNGIRVTPNVYTTIEEIARFTDAMKQEVFDA